MAKKKKSIGKAIVFSAVILSFSAALFYYLRIYTPASFIHYNEFGIEMPVNYSIHGIDVSRYQERISWKDVAAMEVNGIRIGFAFIKATEGTDHKDKQFNRNWNNIKKTGLPAGAYHYFIASRSGKAQAVHFIKEVELVSGDLPPVLDVEESFGVSPAELRQRVADWLFMAERAYKVKPIIYTNPDFYKVYLAGVFDDYPLWIAHYQEQNKPRIKRDWVLWQHNERGHVSGIRGYVDFNVFNGDSMAFRKILIP